MNVLTKLDFTARDYGFTPYVDCPNWIDGKWEPAASGEELPVTNPRYGKVMGAVALSGASDVGKAVEAARRAFPGWRDTPYKERVQVMFNLKRLLEERTEELSWLVSHENGKTYEESAASVKKGIECVEFGCSLPNLAQGTQLDVSRGINCEVSYVPVGVCAGVTPFNFPVMVPLWMLPQALVSGNTFVLKPSEQVPYGGMRLAELLREAGLPDGVFNVVNGAREVVEALCDHPEVAAMAFVGSTRVARQVYARGTAAGKRMLCLGGAKNHLLVVPDADPELTAQTVVASFLGCAGQRCMAASVMVAVGDVQPIIDRMKDYAGRFELGKDMGPIISPQARDRINAYIDQAEKMGARVVVDGRGASVPGAPGNWVGPTILDNVTPDMPCANEEIFGPVLSILHVDTLDEGIALENRSPYGNAAAIFTTNGGIARHAVSRFRAGMCGVNIGVPVPREPFSFGGWFESKFGHGDITGYDGFRFWTNPRKLTARWELAKDRTWMS